MDNQKLFYEEFKDYYEKGMLALKQEKYEIAKKHILIAAEKLLNSAKNTSSVDLKKERIKRAEELKVLALAIDQKINKVQIKKEKKEITTIKDIEKEELRTIVDELNQLEGLENVKTQIEDLISQIKNFKLRKEKGLPTPDMSYHMVFTGNPGTGKTTVARIVGRIYKALGILSKGHVLEVSRSDLVAGYMGQTAIKTHNLIKEKALGGVLFIDEAYSLNQSDRDEFGQEAIDTLNKMMEDYRNDLVVIVAGYSNKIDKFIKSNQGLKSRFRTYIDFKNYSPDELFNIFLALIDKNGYKLSTSARKTIYKYLSESDKNNFVGNARDIRNLFENVVKMQSKRLSNIINPTKEELEFIEEEDLPFLEPDKKTANFITLENPEKEVLKQASRENEIKFDWDTLPSVNFDDIAGLEKVKNIVKTKVILPITHPEAFEGYVKKNGGGLFLYGPPGTGKTMVAAAIANEIGAKFCPVKPSDLLMQGAGNTEKAVRSLFEQARQYPCAVIYFDEIDALAQKNTKSSYSKQLRSELLAQIQGIESYNAETNNILFLIASTNKPWDVDSAFIRPGRFGTPLYIGLPEYEAREYMISKRFNEIKNKKIVSIEDNIDIEEIINKTRGFNGSDISNLLDKIEELSILRGVNTGEKIICQEDVDKALEEISSTVQSDDIEKLIEWKDKNNK